MATPQEKRWLRLAVGHRAITREQAQECLDFQGRKRAEGSKLPVWDCAVLQNMLDQDLAEKLQRAAGDLKVEKLGSFEIISKLGEGGMGSVWKAMGPGKRLVAVKLLAPHLAAQRPLLTRFFREAQAAIKLQHPNIVRGLEVAEDSGFYFFAMEFVDGRSVREILRESGPLPPARATELILQVGKGLAYAHENGIIHRDIKPDNIMVTREGTAKLADLGLARQIDAEVTALTRTGTAMGTPYYMAPEQGNDAKRADARSDVYSLGATWYHMVTGHVPFDGATPLEIWQKHLKEPVKAPSSLQPAVPRNVSLTIERMMAKDPDQRIQTVREVCRMIEERCLGERDVARELGLDKPQAQEQIWEVKVAVGGRVEKRRLSVSDLRTRIRKGQITRETPARRLSGHSEYQPAGSFRDLEREFPRDYATATVTHLPTEKPGTRHELHQLVTEFDSAQTSYARKRALKKLVPLLVKLGILGAIIVLIWRMWPSISSLWEPGAAP